MHAHVLVCVCVRAAITKCAVFRVLNVQLPGYVQARDMTDMLVEQGYFGSYNLPLFEEVRGSRV